MTREFIMTQAFDHVWRQLGLGDHELRELQEMILADPEKGDVMTGTGGLRKIRFKYQSKGKRSGGRVLYVDFKILEKVYLIHAYEKGSTEDISNAEKKVIKKQIAELKREATKRR